MRALAMLLLAACTRSAPSPAPDVKVFGALREMIHEGRTEARVAIASVAAPKTYGLGALEGMRGEVTLVDGTPWIAVGELAEGRATAGPTEASAALLVVATIPAWREIRIDKDIAPAELDARIEAYLAAAGVATDRVVPFVIDGVVDARWHVLKGPPAAGTNAHDHAKNAVVGTLAGTATVVGFFSKHHQGVFTHMGKTVHAHVVDARAAIAAHADELGIRAGSVLRVPR